MPKIPYIPYNEELAAIFEYAGLTIQAQDYGPNRGWDPTEFNAAIYAAQDYIYDNEVDDEEEMDFINFLANYDYTLFYWSVEGSDY